MQTPQSAAGHMPRRHHPQAAASGRAGPVAKIWKASSPRIMPRPVQIVFGVHDEADPAIEVVRALQAKYPHCDTAIVADTRALWRQRQGLQPDQHAARRQARHAGAVATAISRVPRDWLAQVTGALAQPGRRARHLPLYRRARRAATACGPTLAAMGTSYDFLPNVVLGHLAGPGRSPAWAPPSRSPAQMLDEIGGFAAFADYLADDYEMGRAVRALGYALAIPGPGRQPYRHREASARNFSAMNCAGPAPSAASIPLGHLGSIITFALPPSR